MAMVDVRNSFLTALGDGYTLLSAMMGYDNADKSQVFTFTFYKPDGSPASATGKVYGLDDVNTGVAKIATDWKAANP